MARAPVLEKRRSCFDRNSRDASSTAGGEFEASRSTNRDLAILCELAEKQEAQTSVLNQKFTAFDHVFAGALRRQKRSID
jgi:hypothetical protein